MPQNYERNPHTLAIPPLLETPPEPGTTHILGIDPSALPQSVDALTQQAERLQAFVHSKIEEFQLMPDSSIDAVLRDARDGTTPHANGADKAGWHERIVAKASQVGIPLQGNESIEDIAQQVHSFYYDAALGALRAHTLLPDDRALQHRANLLATTLQYAYHAVDSPNAIDPSPDAPVQYPADLLDPAKIAQLSETQAEAIAGSSMFRSELARYVNTEPSFFGMLKQAGVDPALLSPLELRTYFEAAHTVGLPSPAMPYEQLADLVEAYQNYQRLLMYKAALLEMCESEYVEDVGYVVTGFPADTPAWLANNPAILNQPLRRIKLSWHDIGRAIRENVPGFRSQLQVIRDEQAQKRFDTYRPINI